jgi:DNA-binding NtrC family response regulator
VLEGRHLPMLTSTPPPGKAAPAAAPEAELLPLREVERRHIERVLGASGWNKRRACAVLEISRPTLDRKIEEYGLARPAGAGDDE